MNRTVAIFFGFALLLHGAITQTDVTAQSQFGSRPNQLQLELPEALEETAEPKLESKLEDAEPKSVSDEVPKAESEQASEPNWVDNSSPREVLDISTTERTPEQTGADLALPDVNQVASRSFKPVAIANDQFYHRAVPFEEPLHEQYGVSRAPCVQLTTSTLVFFGKSLLLPANLLPRRYNQRGCELSESWIETQGRDTILRCE